MHFRHGLWYLYQNSFVIHDTYLLLSRPTIAAPPPSVSRLKSVPPFRLNLIISSV